MTDISPRYRNRAITAAGATLSPKQRRIAADTHPAGTADKDSADLWRYRDTMPGPNWFSRFVSEQMRLVRFHLAVADGQDPEPVRAGDLNDDGLRVYTPDEEIGIDIVAGIRSRAGDKGSLIAPIVDNLIVDGRAMMVGISRADVELQPTDTEAWATLGSEVERRGTLPELPIEAEDAGPEDEILWFEAHSLDSARVKEGRVEKSSTVGGKWERLSEHSRGLLIYTKHPRHGTLTDSPFRAAYKTLQQLEKLDHLVDAAIDSRLLGRGILLVPSMKIDVPEWLDSYKPEGGTFWDALLRAMATAIEDRQSVAAVAPISVQVPGDMIEKFRHIEFPLAMDEFFQHLHERLRADLAEAWSVPTSQMSAGGIGDLNHWSQWAEQESTIRATWRPLSETIASAWTELILHPALRAQGVKDWERYVVWYDLDALIEKPIRTGDALSLYEAGLIDAETTVTASGFAETEMPVDDERVEWLLQRLMFAAPQLAPQILPLLIPDAIPVAEPAPPTPPPPAADPDPVEGPPDGTGPMTASGAYPAQLEALVWSVLREREWIGRRLRGLCNGQLAETITGVAPEDIAATLGREITERLTGGADDLARPAAFGELRHAATDLGTSPTTLVEMASSFTLSTLYEPWRSASRRLRN